MRKLATLLAAVLLSLSLMGQDGGATAGKAFRVGVDVSADGFLSNSWRFPISAGIGVRVRYGRPDQWINLIGGLRYIYGTRLSGPQVPLLMNVNFVRTRAISAYIGGGFEFDFIGTYWGSAKFQTGLLLGPHLDLQLSYKPYQEALGVGVTYYF